MSNFIEYKGYFICKFGENLFRVKKDPDDSFAVHHGTFESIRDAEKHIDLRQADNEKYFEGIRIPI